MTTHTPGPWRAIVPPSACMTTRFVETEHGEHICKVGHLDFCHDDPAIDDANARLIAAAPELLDALRECITEDGATCMNTGQKSRRLEAINAIARAAIAKATGSK